MRLKKSDLSQAPMNGDMMFWGKTGLFPIMAIILGEASDSRSNWGQHMLFSIMISVLPLAIAVIFGMVAEHMGAKSLSGLFAMGGLGVGVYLIYVVSLHVSFE
jgi:hypothetical protein